MSTVKQHRAVLSDAAAGRDLLRQVLRRLDEGAYLITRDPSLRSKAIKTQEAIRSHLDTPVGGPPEAQLARKEDSDADAAEPGVVGEEAEAHPAAQGQPA